MVFVDEICAEILFRDLEVRIFRDKPWRKFCILNNFNFTFLGNTIYFLGNVTLTCP